VKSFESIYGVLQRFFRLNALPVVFTKKIPVRVIVYSARFPPNPFSLDGIAQGHEDLGNLCDIFKSFNVRSFHVSQTHFHPLLNTSPALLSM
jgi:hypothetical protein